MRNTLVRTRFWPELFRDEVDLRELIGRELVGRLGAAMARIACQNLYDILHPG